jgi:peptidoglycan/LPS O-acetylase OafA/YrhL
MLRGLAALGVVIGHVRGFVVVDYGAVKDASVSSQAFYSVTSLGHQCVIAFFALSGFLVGGPALRNIFAGDWHWPRYTLRRLTRLWIVLIPALLLTFAVDTAGETIGGRFGYEGGFHKLLHSGPSAGLPADLSVTTFVAYVFFLQTIVTPTFGTNGPLWSLANEYWYYVLFPLLIIGLFGRSKDVIRVTMGLVGIALVVLLPIEMVLLGLIWIVGAVANWSLRIVSRYNALSMWPFWFALCLTVIALAIAVDKGWPGVPADLCLGAAFGATLIVLTLLPNFGSIYEGVATFLAKISYTLYATHFPVLAFIWFVVLAPNRCVFGQAALGLCGFLLIITMLVATGMWWLFERNTERVRNVLETLLLGSENERAGRKNERAGSKAV